MGEILKVFGRRVRSLRRAKDMTQEQLAERTFFVAIIAPAALPILALPSPRRRQAAGQERADLRHVGQRGGLMGQGVAERMTRQIDGDDRVMGRQQWHHVAPGVG